MLKSYTEQHKPNKQSKKLTKHNKCTQVINQRFKVFLPLLAVSTLLFFGLMLGRKCLRSSWRTIACFNFVVNKFRENKAIFVHVFPKKINK